MESAPRNLVHSRICQEIDQIMMALRSDITNFEEDSSICSSASDIKTNMRYTKRAPVEKDDSLLLWDKL